MVKIQYQNTCCVSRMLHNYVNYVQFHSIYIYVKKQSAFVFMLADLASFIVSSPFNLQVDLIYI